MKNYKISYTFDEETASTIEEAINLVRAHLKRHVASGWWIESAGGKTETDEIIADCTVNGVGNREWVIMRNVDVANSAREYAVIEEEEQDAE